MDDSLGKANVILSKSAFMLTYMKYNHFNYDNEH